MRTPWIGLRRSFAQPRPLQVRQIIDPGRVQPRLGPDRARHDPVWRAVDRAVDATMGVVQAPAIPHYDAVYCWGDDRWDESSAHAPAARPQHGPTTRCPATRALSVLRRSARQRDGGRLSSTVLLGLDRRRSCRKRRRHRAHAPTPLVARLGHQRAAKTGRVERHDPAGRPRLPCYFANRYQRTVTPWRERPRGFGESADGPQPQRLAAPRARRGKSPATSPVSTMACADSA